jgi:hypothetical protein
VGVRGLRISSATEHRRQQQDESKDQGFRLGLVARWAAETSAAVVGMVPGGGRNASVLQQQRQRMSISETVSSVVYSAIVPLQDQHGAESSV